MVVLIFYFIKLIKILFFFIIYNKYIFIFFTSYTRLLFSILNKMYPYILFTNNKKKHNILICCMLYNIHVMKLFQIRQEQIVFFATNLLFDSLSPNYWPQDIRLRLFANVPNHCNYHKKNVFPKQSTTSWHILLETYYIHLNAFNAFLKLFPFLFSLKCN